MLMANDCELTGEEIYRRLREQLGDEAASRALHDAGIHGIKYLDQGSRVGFDLNEMKSRIADVNAKIAATSKDSAAGRNNIDALKSRARDLEKQIADYKPPTRNYVVFDHNDIEITHKNGEPVKPPAPPTPPPPEEPPSGAGGPGPADAWRQRFDASVAKLNTGEDIKQLIKDAADAQENFPAARRGDVPLAHVEQIADAAGVDPALVDARGLGRQFKTDAEVRLAYQAMLTLTEKVKEAARGHKTEPTEKSRIALQEALMRRDMAVEQVVGFRAEWGRVGNTIQEFMARVKNQEQLGEFLDEQGRGRAPKDLDRIADAVDAMDRAGGNVPGFLNDARKRGFADKLFWYWQNDLISGWLTHTKYAAANATWLVWNRGVITPFAQLLQARSLGDVANIPFHALSGIAGSISATPMAFMTALRSVKTGLRVPLEGETELAARAAARGEPPPKFAAKPFTPQERPISGRLGRAIGAPGDAANALHTFFRIIGYEGEMQAQAYLAAQKEGLNPLRPEFWDRQAQIRANSTEAMMQQGIDVANKGTFVQESGSVGKALQKIARTDFGKGTKDSKSIQPLRWVFPFTHIPLNLMKATVEGTPAPLVAAFFKDSEMGKAIRGEMGADVQAKSIAHMVAGSAIMGYFVMKALNGEATGDYPSDPKDKDLWVRTNKQPNSILIGDHWVSFNKFGPIGDLMGIGATLGQAIPHLKSEDSDEMEKATWYLAQSAGRIVTDEVGMLSLQMLFEAMKDDKKATTFISSMASSFLPASSFLGQTASFMDPEMRQAKTIVDGFKYRIPGERETLLPKRDWSGVPVPNPQYGNILRQTQAQADPIDLEMARLGIHPAPPQDRIGGVKLPPGLYDKYHASTAPLTRMMLGNLVDTEGWNDLPPGVREDVIRKTIAAARKYSASAMQMAYPQIIQQGVDNKINKLIGAEPGKLPEPAVVQPEKRSMLEMLNPISSAEAAMLPEERANPRPGRVPGEGGGGSSGGRIEFQSSGAKRSAAPSGAPASPASPVETAEQAAARKAEMKRAFDEEVAKAEKKYGKPKGLSDLAKPGDEGRIGFKSLETKK
jgi:hypothetical protein